ncbi:MAG: DUF1838 domain-containing protein [Gammaproteobacteria bacterium]|nr:DUF1838 domain-containing protein [Gammaproteobacteria bacterium]MYK38193.1 DUF1838 domain-containing protein [Gammaproteobacteria bacterium]
MNCALPESICRARHLLHAACVAIAVGLSVPTAAAELPDLTDPRTAMETWLRLKGDIAGGVTYEWATGTAYGVPQDADGVALFAIESVTIRQFRRLSEDQYEERTIACRLYRDAFSGAFIDEFINPLTGNRTELRLPCGAGQPVRYSPERVALLADVPWQSSILDRPVTLELLRAGDEVIIRRRAFSAFTPAGGKVRRELAVDTFALPAASLADPGITSLSPSYSWDAVRDWSGFLAMGDLPGHMYWSVVGRKFRRVQELPAEFRAALEESDPGALERTPDWEAGYD